MTAGSHHTEKKNSIPCWGGEGVHSRVEVGNESSILPQALGDRGEGSK